MILRLFNISFKRFEIQKRIVNGYFFWILYVYIGIPILPFVVFVETSRLHITQPRN